MKIGFIGAGKVGFSLGKFLAEKGVQVTGYYNRHQETAQEAAEFTDSKCFESISMLARESDTIFITVADGAINSVYEQLKKFKITGKHICHCSGSMTAIEAFPDIEKFNAFGYSIHPLFPISDKYTTYKKLQDAFFCIEGSIEHLEMWKNFLGDMGMNVREISSESKAKYHAACAISSNLVCGLIYESTQLLAQCGFDKDDGLKALEPLITANIAEALRVGPIEALTGPVERCDTETVRKHLKCFDTENEKAMYSAVSDKLVDIAELKHPERDYTELKNVLH